MFFVATNDPNHPRPLEVVIQLYVLNNIKMPARRAFALEKISRNDFLSNIWR
jgi:hypothetical protein